MASISSVSSTPAPYTPVAKATPRPTSSSKPVTPTVGDKDHDGDTDGPGIDVKG